MRHMVRCLNVLASIGLFLGFATATGFAANPHCYEVGGAILTNVGGFGVIDEQPTTLGVATGDLKGAIGVVILNDSTPSIFHVQHHWVTENGETLFVDPAYAHGTFVNNPPSLFAITDYKVHLSGGTGRFAGATGDMKAIGEIDLVSGQLVLRYSGQICEVPTKARQE